MKDSTIVAQFYLFTIYYPHPLLFFAARDTSCLYWYSHYRVLSRTQCALRYVLH